MAEEKNEWKSVTLGQSPTIQEIAGAAATASELLEVNTKLASTTLKAAGAFLLALLNPYIALLLLVADLIDDYVKDFKNIGFYVLEVSKADTIHSDDLTDLAKEPILLPLTSAGIIAVKALAMAANQGEQFSDWAWETLFERNILLTGPQKAVYNVGVKQPVYGGTDNSNDDTMGIYNELLGVQTMTPSIVIATMISAMDDEKDLRRPQFSSNAEAGAIVIVMGIADLTKNLATIKDTFDAFLFFFGGDETYEKNPDGSFVTDECGNKKTIAPGGIVSGLGKFSKVINAAFGGVQCPALHNVTIKVQGVCGVRGTEDDKGKLISIGKSANKKGLFKTGDYVVGPRAKLGSRCMGYVSHVIKDTTIQMDTVDPYTQEKIYYEQDLVITALTDFDKNCWNKLSSGAKISKVAFKERYNSYIDSNSGIPVTSGPFNDYEYISEIQTRTERERFPGSTVTIPQYEFQEVAEYTPTIILQLKYAQTKDATIPYLNIFNNDESLRTEWEGVDTSILTINRQDSGGNKIEASPSGKEAWTNVVRPAGKTLLQVNSKLNEDVTEDHEGAIQGAMFSRGTSKFTTFNTVQGDIRASVETIGAVPNFKSIKMEDFISEWGTFFSAIDALTDQLREMAADAGKALKDLITWLDEKIKEIEEINEALQKILKLFTTGLGDSGVYVLNIPMGTGGNDYIKKQLQSAANKPPDTLELSIGFMMVGGGIGSASTGFKLIQKLLVP